MRCDEFRAACDSGDESPEMLAHLRTCDECLNHAVERGGDFLFRGIGGEIVPPGGVEVFAAGVMSEIHIRETERKMKPNVRRFVPARKWAIAAVAAVAVISGAIMWPRGGQAPAPVQVAVLAPAVRPAVLVSKPVVERYSSSNATIVEVPQEETGDIKVVMIFDESLPADL